MSQTEAPEAGPFFLELTFNGGRFALHSLPIDVVSELTTVQELVEKVARHLFFEENQGKQRVPKGFFEAAQLHLVASADNCYTAKLQRPLTTKLGLFESTLFENARSIVLGALLAVSAGQALPVGFPSDAIDCLASLGRRLNDDEALVMRAGDSRLIATVTQDSRRKLADQYNRPLEKIETIDGEVDRFNDDKTTFQIRTRDREQIEIPFERVDKERLVNALKNRPIERVRVRGKVLQTQFTRKLQSVEDLDIVDDERAPEIQKLWDRLKSFEQIKSGWMYGGGAAPTQTAITRAKETLARLLVEYPHISRPKIYPTPSGSVQAEWMLNQWMVDLIFDHTSEVITAEATQTTTGAEKHGDFDAVSVTPTDVKSLANWLNSLT